MNKTEELLLALIQKMMMGEEVRIPVARVATARQLGLAVSDNGTLTQPSVALVQILRMALVSGELRPLRYLIGQLRDEVVVGADQALAVLPARQAQIEAEKAELQGLTFGTA